MSSSVPVTPPSSTLRVPPEILGEVFSYCDAATLSAISRVSFACLELTTKLLYEDVVLDNVDSLELLLRRNLPSSETDPASPSKSTRISPHTSLGLIFSVTFTGYVASEGENVADVELPDDCPALDIPVLAVCIPPNGFISMLRSLLHLINPVTFIAQGPLRPSLPSSSASNSSSSSSQEEDEEFDPSYWPLINLNDAFRDRPPSTVILSGVILDDWYTLALPPPAKTRILVDFLDGEESRKNRISQAYTYGEMWSNVADQFQMKHSNFYPDYELRVWLSSEETREAVQEMFDDDKNDFYAEEGSPVFCDAATPRLKRFRGQMYKGLKKWMDWGALDEVMPSQETIADVQGVDA